MSFWVGLRKPERTHGTGDVGIREISQCQQNGCGDCGRRFGIYNGCRHCHKNKGVTLAHLVAGTRSFDIKMPKEINRLVIDGLSDLLFTAGMGSNNIATREGAELSHVYMVGNILMDTLRFNYNRLQRPAVLDTLGVKKKNISFSPLTARC